MVAQISDRIAVSSLVTAQLRPQTKRATNPDLGMKIVSRIGRGPYMQQQALEFIHEAFQELAMTVDDLFNYSTNSESDKWKEFKEYLFIDDLGFNAIKAVLRSPDAEEQAHYKELTTIRSERFSQMSGE